jgi:hypothetical protein
MMLGLLLARAGIDVLVLEKRRLEQFGMLAKIEKMKAGDPNPFIDQDVRNCSALYVHLTCTGIIADGSSGSSEANVPH